MSLNHFSMFPNELVNHFLDYLSSDTLFKLLITTVQKKSINNEDTLFLVAFQILLSRNRTKQDIDYQTQAIRLCLTQQEDLNPLRIYSSKIIESIKTDASTLEHKIQIILFLCKMYDISLSKNLRNKLFEHDVWRYFSELLLPLSNKTDAQHFLSEFNLDNVQQAWILSALPANQLKDNLDRFASIFFNTEKHSRLDYIIKSMSDLKKITSQFTRTQLNNFIHQIETKEQDNSAKCILWALLFPHLTSSENEVVFQRILSQVLLKDAHHKYAFNALKSIFPKLTTPQIEDAFWQIVNSDYINHAHEMIMLLASKINTPSLNDACEHLQKNAEKEPILVMILLNEQVVRSPKKDRVSKLNNMINLLSNIPLKLYQKETIYHVLANLTPDAFELFSNTIIDTLDQNPAKIPFHIRMVLSKLAYRFKNEQLSRIRAFIKPFIKPLLNMDNSSECQPKEIFYKLTAGITLTEALTYIPLLSSNEINALGHQQDVDNTSLNKFIAKIAAQFNEQQEKDLAFNMFFTMMNEDLDNSDFHFFMCQFIQFIPSITPLQAHQTAELLIKLLEIKPHRCMNNNFCNELMPFETIEPVSQIRYFDTENLLQHALNLVIQKMKPENRSSFLTTLSQQKDFFKNQFACNTIIKYYIKGEEINFNAQTLEPSDDALFVNLQTLIIDAWNNLLPVIEQHVTNDKKSKITKLSCVYKHTR